MEYAREHMGEVQARRVYEYLRVNGGDRSFGAIWEDESNPLLGGLRNREAHRSGRCADCRTDDEVRGPRPFEGVTSDWWP